MKKFSNGEFVIDETQTVCPHCGSQSLKQVNPTLIQCTACNQKYQPTQVG